MKEIKLKTRASVLNDEVSKNGEFIFQVVVTDAFEDELEKSVKQLIDLWNSGQRASLCISMRTRDLFESIHDLYQLNGTEYLVEEKDMPVFAALQQDCEWIIKEIDKLMERSAPSLVKAKE